MLNEVFNRTSAKFIKLSVLIASVITPLTTVVLSADALPRSSFQESCKDIDLDDVVLSAKCKDTNGNFHDTQLNLMGIHNQDGSLVQGNIGSPSSFQDSCTNIRLMMNRTPQGLSDPWINADCPNQEGQVRRPGEGIPLNGIVNKNGELSY